MPFNYYLRINNYYVNSHRCQKKDYQEKPKIFSAIQLYHILPFALSRINNVSKIGKTEFYNTNIMTLATGMAYNNIWLIDKIIDSIALSIPSTKLLPYFILMYGISSKKNPKTLKYAFDRIIQNLDIDDVTMSTSIICLSSGYPKLIDYLIQDRSRIRRDINLLQSHFNIPNNIQVNPYRSKVFNWSDEILSDIFGNVISIKYLLNLDVDLALLWKNTCIFGKKKTIKYLMSQFQQFDRDMEFIKLILSNDDTSHEPITYHLTYKQIIYINSKYHSIYSPDEPIDSPFMLTWAISQRDLPLMYRCLKTYKPTTYDIVSLFLESKYFDFVIYFDQEGMIDWLFPIAIESISSGFDRYPSNRWKNFTDHDEMGDHIYFAEYLFHIFYKNYIRPFSLTIITRETNIFDNASYTIRRDYLLQYININNVYAIYGIPDIVDLYLAKQINYDYLSIRLPQDPIRRGSIVQTNKLIRASDAIIMHPYMGEHERLKAATNKK